MSPGSLDKIIAKLQRLEEYLGYLREIQKIEKRKFIANFHHFGLAERYLQLAIECVLDISKLTIIELNLRRAGNNHEIFEILFEAKIISKALFSKLRGIAGFRNILVHDYERIDREIVYDNLKNSLNDFESFKRAIKKSVL